MSIYALSSASLCSLINTIYPLYLFCKEQGKRTEVPYAQACMALYQDPDLRASCRVCLPECVWLAKSLLTYWIIIGSTGLWIKLGCWRKHRLFLTKGMLTLSLLLLLDPGYSSCMWGLLPHSFPGSMAIIVTNCLWLVYLRMETLWIFPSSC